MDKRTKIIIGLFAAVLLTIMVTEVVRPKPINWKPSYTSSDKIPFGCHVLFSELSTLFPENEILSVNESLYQVLSEQDVKDPSNYILIDDRIGFDKEEYNEMLEYVSNGNDIFIASAGFGPYLSDTLNIDVAFAYSMREDSIALNLTNRTFKKKEFNYRRRMENRHFTSVDSARTTILGNITFSEENNPLVEGKQRITRPNFIKVAFGMGSFYLNTSPQAFSNYYMLNDNQEYVANALSYIEGEAPIFWDNYKKSGRVFIESPLRFVLNQAPLRWAYYLAIIGLFIFILFRAKREQRIIPVIEPLENSSIEFARTVGTLYHQHKNYTDLIAKKLNFFTDYVRSTFYLDTHTIDDRTALNLAAKSGKPLAETKELIEFIVYLKGKTMHTEDNLIQLNKKITSFKK